MTLRSAEVHYSEQAALAEVVRRRIEALFASVDPEDVNAWSGSVLPAARLVTRAQLRAAQGSEAYVAAALAEQGLSVAPEASVAAAGFAGRASDGRPLATLLDQPRIRTLTLIGQGGEPADVLSRARSAVVTMAVTQVQDAGRQADSVATFARPRVGWVRMVNAPCCKDCAILAGRWYRSNEGFLRHPRCDCRHVPAAEDAADDAGTDPAALFGSGNVTGLRDAERQAISDGADPIQVVNSGRGANRNKMTTTEGTTKRGVAYRAGVRGARLTPDGIYRISSDRDEALRLLARNGYIR